MSFIPSSTSGPGYKAAPGGVGGRTLGSTPAPPGSYIGGGSTPGGSTGGGGSGGGKKGGSKKKGSKSDREARRNRTTMLKNFRMLYPWMPKELAEVWVTAWQEYGDSDLAWQEVRNGSGQAVYDQTFKGNRREDGTLRLSEPQYLSTLAQYRNTLAQRGLSPRVFEDRLTNLIEGEVSAQEFEQRVAAVNESIAQQSEEIRRAFAEASGVADFTPEAVLATVLDPEGVGRELLERRISVAQVRGSAAEFGFSRSQERVESVLQQVDLSRAQAREFYAQAGRRVDMLSDAARRFEGSGGVRVEDLEDAFLLQEQDDVDRLTGLLQRERAAFSSRRGATTTTQEGAITGLQRAPQR